MMKRGPPIPPSTKWRLRGDASPPPTQRLPLLSHKVAIRPIAAAVSSKRPSSASFGARDYRAGGGQFTADGGQFTADEGQFTVGVRVCAGFNVESVQYKSVVLTMWDVGGQTRLRPLWRHYLKDTDALIYVVDAHDRDRVAEAADEFHVRIFP
eukprot:8224372-Pyramimonas_sp.AAC.1